MRSLFRTLLKPQKQILICNSCSHLSPPSVIHSTLTSSTTLKTQTQNNDPSRKTLHLLFQEALGLCETTKPETHEETNELNKKIWELEREVRDLRVAESKKGKQENVKNANRRKKEVTLGKGLYSLFLGKSEMKVEMTRKEDREESHKVFKEEKKRMMEREERHKVFKEMSSDMQMFITHLYKEGYLNNANFLKDANFDFKTCFNDSYGRDFVKYAAEKFGKDHQEIAKWLSGSDLRKVALFGCPTVTRKSVFSAKSLRKFLEIQEETVCSKCVLKHACNFVNQSASKGDIGTLNLAAVMRVITLYALEATHPDLAVPNEIKASVKQLLNEILKLSQTLHPDA